MKRALNRAGIQSFSEHALFNSVGARWQPANEARDGNDGGCFGCVCVCVCVCVWPGGGGVGGGSGEGAAEEGRK
jgi:hypothetical protein